MSGRGLALAAAALGAAATLLSCAESAPTPRPLPTATTTTTPTRTSAPPPVEFEVARVVADIDQLAIGIGPRPATSAAYREAAGWVTDRFDALGYQVRLMNVRTPAGNSWGVEVGAGNSPNVIAQRADFDPTAPHVVVGAHLDTVPVSPGAEDNASGVAVLLELARDLAPQARQVRFIAFGAEEPRGPGDNLHHFGSRAYVRSLEGSERAAMRAMVSLDRVGVRGRAVPICTGGVGSTAIRTQLRDTARRLGVPHTVCADNRSSDHWSFERAGLPSARIGSIPYAGYHSARDLPGVISAGQLGRVGTIMLAWLRGH